MSIARRGIDHKASRLGSLLVCMSDVPLRNSSTWRIGSSVDMSPSMTSYLCKRRSLCQSFYSDAFLSQSQSRLVRLSHISRGDGLLHYFRKGSFRSRIRVQTYLLQFKRSISNHLSSAAYSQLFRYFYRQRSAKYPHSVVVGRVACFSSNFWQWPLTSVKLKLCPCSDHLRYFRLIFLLQRYPLLQLPCSRRI